MNKSRNLLYGSFLLLPAAALLWTFTYQPVLATFYNSFFSTPKGRRPSVFIGVDHYVRMIEDPVFWQALSSAWTSPLLMVSAQFPAPVH